MRCCYFRWVVLCAAVFAVGCAGGQSRRIRISTRPPGASIQIDGVNRGPAPVSHDFPFRSNTEVHRVVASKPGYKDTVLEVTSFEDRSAVTIDLQPLSKWVTFEVVAEGKASVPAIVSVNGQALSPVPVSSISKELTFEMNSDGRWTPHRVTARAQGWEDATGTVNWTDKIDHYTLKLEPKRKPLRITTDQDGAEFLLDNKLIGTGKSVIVDPPGYPFPADDEGNLPTYELEVRKRGFVTAKASIRGDDSQTVYHVSLLARSKPVRVITEPPDAVVRVDGADMEPKRGPGGAWVIEGLRFPIDQSGESEVYTITAEKPGWKKAMIRVGWDGRRVEYPVRLEPVTELDARLLAWKPTRGDKGWAIVPQPTTALAMKDVKEPQAAEAPERITEDLPAGTVVDALTVAPDGSQILFTTVRTGPDGKLLSRMQLVSPDHIPGPELSTGASRATELTPSFTPDGQQILFASDRGDKGVGIWSIPVNGGEPTRLTDPAAGAVDLWPCVDSDPRPRLFFESRPADTREPILLRSQLGTTTREALIETAGTQPRVSPRADQVVYTAADAKTGKRDVYLVSDRGGKPTNLTETPDVDECDPAWSFEGGMLAFASDRGADAQGRRHYDVYVMDMQNPGLIRRVTANASRDDRPAWDPAGEHLYFRSNRGGEWNVWKIGVK